MEAAHELFLRQAALFQDSGTDGVERELVVDRAFQETALDDAVQHAQCPDSVLRELDCAMVVIRGIAPAEYVEREHVAKLVRAQVAHDAVNPSSGESHLGVAKRSSVFACFRSSAEQGAA